MFDPKREIERITAFIRDYYEKNGLKGAVLGISGGKDSGVVAGLFCRALGPENVVGLTLPCHSKSDDRTDALEVGKKFGFRMYNLDLTPVFDDFRDEVLKLELGEEKDYLNSDINLKPRLRMAACYYMAALLSAVNGGAYLVAGTSNACELYVGYFTKGGDSVHDISPLAKLTVDEVIAIGEELGVPDVVIHKAPSDGLSGMSDEEKMGIHYANVARVLKGEEVEDKEELAKIERMHRNSAHKFSIPTYDPKA